MTHTLIALLGYALWTLFLLFALINFRGMLVLTGKKAVNDFATDGADVSALSQRLVRAHANCFENIGVAAAILLTAIVTENTAITESLAFIFLGARLAQSIVHIISTSPIAVWLRVTFQSVQIFILVYWVVMLLKAVI